MLHLVVAYDAGLLHCYAAGSEDDEIGDAANVEAGGELRILFGIDFQHYGLARHIGCGSSDFRSGGTARSAPFRPEVDEDRNLGILNDFIEEGIVDCDGFRDGWQRRFARAATAGAGEILCWNAVLLAAIGACADDGHIDLRR